MTIIFEKNASNLASTSSPYGVVAAKRHPGVYRNGVKRVFDTIVVLLVAPLVLLIVLVLALIAARDGYNPFYLSTRVGKNGKNFRMLKLRSMVPNAERLLDQHLAANSAARQEWQTTQKLKRDPRITRFGQILRKSSMDELPQLWNVLVGDMALVGPRPMLPNQRAMYPGLAYYSLRPGITGMWQVSDRNDSEFAKRADFDREYDHSISFSTDVGLLMKTVGVVIKGTGY